MSKSKGKKCKFLAKVKSFFKRLNEGRRYMEKEHQKRWVAKNKGLVDIWRKICKDKQRNPKKWRGG